MSGTIPTIEITRPEARVILIDDRPTRGRRGMDWYHMATDGGMEELHGMARRLGLRPQWLHHHPGLPHYDVPEEVKRKAISLGAAEVTTRELVRRCKRRDGKIPDTLDGFSAHG